MDTFGMKGGIFSERKIVALFLIATYYGGVFGTAPRYEACVAGREGEIHEKKSCRDSIVYCWLFRIFLWFVISNRRGGSRQGCRQLLQGRRLLFDSRHDDSPSRLGENAHHQGVDQGAKGQPLYHRRTAKG